MKNMNSLLRYIIVCLGIVGFFSCETSELDLTENPNFLTPDQVDVNLLLNSIQEDFVRNIDGEATGDINDNFQPGGNVGDGFSNMGMELTRLLAYISRDYRSGYQDIDTDDEWDNGYRGIMQDIRILTPIAVESGLTRHLGMAQFIEAYVLVSFVDFFGDVPYTEAFQGQDNLNPAPDNGAAIYSQALSLLDQSISNFQTEAVNNPATDLLYGGNFDNWIKAANTLKLKIYLQSRLVDGSAGDNFNAIIAEGNYIQDTSEDLDWFWPATSASQPDTRHPRYGVNYASAGAADYASNWLINLMDTSDDPRIRYYFYRQNDEVPGQEGVPPNEETLTCSLQTPPAHYVSGGFTFCALPNGYWGRDHGDDEGTPPDGLLRTTWGVYPAGGRFDDNSFEAIAQGNNPDSFGAGGMGITPILDAFMVDFWRAEMAMASGDAPAAAMFLESGMLKQIAKVQSFGSNDPAADLSFAPESSAVMDYVDGIVDAFNSGSNEEKWDILGEQHFTAHYGNGIETYNFYRRTGFPTTLQPNREPNPGEFPRSMYYPSQVVNSNSNISQKPDQTVQVFWDNNPGAGFPVAN